MMRICFPTWTRTVSPHTLEVEHIQTKRELVFGANVTGLQVAGQRPVSIELTRSDFEALQAMPLSQVSDYISKLRNCLK